MLLSPIRRRNANQIKAVLKSKNFHIMNHIKCLFLTSLFEHCSNKRTTSNHAEPSAISMVIENYLNMYMKMRWSSTKNTPIWRGMNCSPLINSENLQIQHQKKHLLTRSKLHVQDFSLYFTQHATLNRKIHPMWFHISIWTYSLLILELQPTHWTENCLS